MVFAQFKTFKGKILAGMFLIVLLAGTIAAYTIYVFYKKARLETIQDLAHNVHTNTYKSLSIGQNFLMFETINPQFFETKNSVFLTNQDKVNKEILEELDEIIRLNKNNDYVNSKNLSDLKKYVEEYRVLWADIVFAVSKKGFKDYGLEGEMRRYIHQIEDNKLIDNTQLLTLRRYEKDYMLRKDIHYLEKLQSYTQGLIAKINTNNQLNSSKKNEVIQLLTKYYTCFNSIAEYDKKIGFNNPYGLISRFRTNIELIEELTSSLSYEAAIVKLDGTAKLYWIYGAMLIVFLGISLLVSNLLANTIARPLVQLNKSVEDLIQKEITGRLPEVDSTDESERLMRNLNNLLNQVRGKS